MISAYALDVGPQNRYWNQTGNLQRTCQNHSMKTILQLDKMTTAEKLQAMEEIWTDLTRDPEVFESPAWHEDVLRERERAVEERREQFIPFSEVKKRLKEHRS